MRVLLLLFQLGFLFITLSKSRTDWGILIFSLLTFLGKVRVYLHTSPPYYSSSHQIGVTVSLQPILLVCWGCITKYHKQEGLNIEMYCLPALEAGCLRSSGWQGWFLSFWYFLAIFGVPLAVETSTHLCLPLHVAFLVCVCMSVSKSFLIRTLAKLY